MRCFYVLIHGKLDWLTTAEAEGGPQNKPTGFYCHRYVLANSEEAAKEQAFGRVRRDLDQQVGWMKSGSATLRLLADETSIAPMRKLLRPDNRGHTFYEGD